MDRSEDSAELRLLMQSELEAGAKLMPLLFSKKQKSTRIERDRTGGKRKDCRNRKEAQNDATLAGPLPRWVFSLVRIAAESPRADAGHHLNWRYRARNVLGYRARMGAS